MHANIFEFVCMTVCMLFNCSCDAAHFKHDLSHVNSIEQVVNWPFPKSLFLVKPL